MAKSKLNKNKIMAYKLIFAIVILWFAWLVSRGSVFGVIGLGVLLVAAGIWFITAAPTVWTHYLSAYKKLPKKRRTIWNKPLPVYYWINRYIFGPVIILLGLVLLFMAFFLDVTAQ